MGILPKWTVLAGLALAGLLAANHLNAGLDQITSQGRMPMTVNQPGADPRVALAPLDAAQPAETQTATFALG